MGVPKIDSRELYRRLCLWDSCRRKQRFPSEYDAMRTAACRVIEGRIDELSAYNCRMCGGWHLTRMRQREEA